MSKYTNSCVSNGQSQSRSIVDDFYLAREIIKFRRQGLPVVLLDSLSQKNQNFAKHKEADVNLDLISADLNSEFEKNEIIFDAEIKEIDKVSEFDKITEELALLSAGGEENGLNESFASTIASTTIVPLEEELTFSILNSPEVVKNMENDPINFECNNAFSAGFGEATNLNTITEGIMSESQECTKMRRRSSTDEDELAAYGSGYVNEPQHSKRITNGKSGQGNHCHLVVCPPANLHNSSFTISQSSVPCELEFCSVSLKEMMNTGLEQEASDDSMDLSSNERPTTSSSLPSAMGKLYGISDVDIDELTPKKAKRAIAKKVDTEKWLDRVRECVESGILPVTCGTKSGHMRVEHFGSGGKGMSIVADNGILMTPRDFEIYGGKKTSQKYLASLQVLGKALQFVVENGLLKPHIPGCGCKVCTDGRMNKEVVYYERRTPRVWGASGAAKVGRGRKRRNDEDGDDEMDLFVYNQEMSLEERRERVFEKLQIPFTQSDYYPCGHYSKHQIEVCYPSRRSTHTHVNEVEFEDGKWTVYDEFNKNNNQLTESCVDVNVGKGNTELAKNFPLMRRNQFGQPDFLFTNCKTELTELKDDRAPRTDFELHVDGVVQNLACVNLDCVGVNECIDCARGSFCRFRDFRILKRVGRWNLAPSGFTGIMETTDSLGAPIELCKWLPPSHSDWPVPTAAYILQNVAETFRNILQYERSILSSMRCQNDGLKEVMPSWRPSENIRELCDVCETTLFNLHWFCPRCSFFVCHQCVQSRILAADPFGEADDTRDSFFWPFCLETVQVEMVQQSEWSDEEDDVVSVSRYRPHHPNRLRPVQLIPDHFPTILHTLNQVEYRLNKVLEEWKIPICCGCDNSQESSNCFCVKESCLGKNDEEAVPTERTFQHLCDGNLLVISYEPNDNHCLVRFQNHWRKSKPIIVVNVHKKLDQEDWSPIAFKDANIRKVKGSGLLRSVIDCGSGNAVGWTAKDKNGVTLDEFWDGFIDQSRRRLNAKGVPMPLKLKDFPTTSTFKRTFRKHYEELCRVMPFPEYSLPEQTGTSGRLNLVTKLPARYVKPDLGPKMYNAYGLINDLERATTNLHLDISDACNILTNVTVSEEETFDKLVWRLNEEGFVEESEDYKRVVGKWREAGAIWTIFHSDDNDKIRQFIIDTVNEDRMNDYFSEDIVKTLKSMTVDDAIHDQRFYITAKMRRDLQAKYGVRGYTFVQMLGDAVFIPAGAPHQVVNLFSCIKVAEDFVTPEGTVWSANITEELRKLSLQHQNRIDKLQLKNIVYFAVCEAITALETAKEDKTTF